MEVLLPNEYSKLGLVTHSCFQTAVNILWKVDRARTPACAKITNRRCPMYQLITATASATTAIRNVYELLRELAIYRRQHRIIPLAKIQLLREAVNRAVALARLDGIHDIEEHARALLSKSLKDVEKYRNTPLGDYYIRSFEIEWNSYQIVCGDYLRCTGGIH